MEKSNGRKIETFSYPDLKDMPGDEVGIVKEEVEAQESHSDGLRDSELRSIIFSRDNVLSLVRHIDDELKQISIVEAKKQELIAKQVTANSEQKEAITAEIEQLEANIAPVRDRLQKEVEELPPEEEQTEEQAEELNDEQKKLIARGRLNAFMAAKRRQVAAHNAESGYFSEEELDSQALKVAAMAFSGDRLVGGINGPKYINPADAVEAALRSENL